MDDDTQAFLDLLSQYQASDQAAEIEQVNKNLRSLAASAKADLKALGVELKDLPVQELRVLNKEFATLQATLDKSFKVNRSTVISFLKDPENLKAAQRTIFFFQEIQKQGKSVADVYQKITSSANEAAKAVSVLAQAQQQQNVVTEQGAAATQKARLSLESYGNTVADNVIETKKLTQATSQFNQEIQVTVNRIQSLKASFRELKALGDELRRPVTQAIAPAATGALNQARNLLPAARSRAGRTAQQFQQIVSSPEARELAELAPQVVGAIIFGLKQAAEPVAREAFDLGKRLGQAALAGLRSEIESFAQRAQARMRAEGGALGVARNDRERLLQAAEGAAGSISSTAGRVSQGAANFIGNPTVRSLIGLPPGRVPLPNVGNLLPAQGQTVAGRARLRSEYERLLERFVPPSDAPIIPNLTLSQLRSSQVGRALTGAIDAQIRGPLAGRPRGNPFGSAFTADAINLGNFPGGFSRTELDALSAEFRRLRQAVAEFTQALIGTTRLLPSARGTQEFNAATAQARRLDEIFDYRESARRVREGRPSAGGLPLLPPARGIQEFNAAVRENRRLDAEQEARRQERAAELRRVPPPGLPALPPAIQLAQTTEGNFSDPAGRSFPGITGAGGFFQRPDGTLERIPTTTPVSAPAALPRVRFARFIAGPGGSVTDQVANGETPEQTFARVVAEQQADYERQIRNLTRNAAAVFADEILKALPKGISDGFARSLTSGRPGVAAPLIPGDNPFRSVGAQGNPARGLNFGTPFNQGATGVSVGGTAGIVGGNFGGGTFNVNPLIPGNGLRITQGDIDNAENIAAQRAIQRTRQRAGAQARAAFQQFRDTQFQLPDLDEIDGLAGAFLRGASGLNVLRRGIADTALQLSLFIFSLQTVGFTLVNTLQPAYDAFIGQNVELQRTVLASAAAITATGKVLKDGLQVDDVTTSIKAVSGALQSELKQLQRQSLDITGVTSQELTGIFNLVANGIVNIAGDSKNALSQVSELSAAFASAFVGLNIPLAQSRQEINSIFLGTIDYNSVLAKTLGITNEVIQREKERGTLIEFLTDRLNAFTVVAAEGSNTIPGIVSNLREFFEIITREVGEDFTVVLTERLRNLYDFLITNKDEIKATVEGIFNAGVGFIDFLGKAFQALVATVQTIQGLLGPLSTTLQAIGVLVSVQLANQFVLFLKPTITLVTTLAATFTAYIGTLGKVNGASALLSVTNKGLAGTFLFLRKNLGVALIGLSLVLDILKQFVPRLQDTDTNFVLFLGTLVLVGQQLKVLAATVTGTALISQFQALGTAIGTAVPLLGKLGPAIAALATPIGVVSALIIGALNIYKQFVAAANQEIKLEQYYAIAGAFEDLRIKLVAINKLEEEQGVLTLAQAEERERLVASLKENIKAREALIASILQEGGNQERLAGIQAQLAEQKKLLLELDKENVTVQQQLATEVQKIVEINAEVARSYDDLESLLGGYYERVGKAEEDYQKTISTLRRNYAVLQQGIINDATLTEEQRIEKLKELDNNFFDQRLQAEVKLVQSVKRISKEYIAALEVTEKEALVELERSYDEREATTAKSERERAEIEQQFAEARFQIQKNNLDQQLNLRELFQSDVARLDKELLELSKEKDAAVTQSEKDAIDERIKKAQQEKDDKLGLINELNKSIEEARNESLDAELEKIEAERKAEKARKKEQLENIEILKIRTAEYYEQQLRNIDRQDRALENQSKKLDQVAEAFRKRQEEENAAAERQIELLEAKLALLDQEIAKNDRVIEQSKTEQQVAIQVLQQRGADGLVQEIQAALDPNAPLIDQLNQLTNEQILEFIQNSQNQIAAGESRNLRVLRQRQELEDQISETQRARLEREDEYQEKFLKIEERKLEIERQRAELAARRAVLEAEKQVQEAQLELQQAQIEGDKVQIEQAQSKLRLAQDSLNTAREIYNETKRQNDEQKKGIDDLIAKTGELDIALARVDNGTGSFLDKIRGAVTAAGRLAEIFGGMPGMGGGSPGDMRWPPNPPGMGGPGGPPGMGGGPSVPGLPGMGGDKRPLMGWPGGPPGMGGPGGLPGGSSSSSLLLGPGGLAGLLAQLMPQKGYPRFDPPGEFGRGGPAPRSGGADPPLSSNPEPEPEPESSPPPQYEPPEADRGRGNDRGGRRGRDEGDPRDVNPQGPDIAYPDGGGYFPGLDPNRDDGPVEPPATPGYPPPGTPGTPGTGIPGVGSGNPIYELPGNPGIRPLSGGRQSSIGGGGGPPGIGWPGGGIGGRPLSGGSGGSIGGGGGYGGGRSEVGGLPIPSGGGGGGLPLPAGRGGGALSAIQEFERDAARREEERIRAEQEAIREREQREAEREQRRQRQEAQEAARRLGGINRFSGFGGGTQGAPAGRFTLGDPRDTELMSAFQKQFESLAANGGRLFGVSPVTSLLNARSRQEAKMPGSQFIYRAGGLKVIPQGITEEEFDSQQEQRRIQTEALFNASRERAINEQLTRERNLAIEQNRREQERRDQEELRARAEQLQQQADEQLRQSIERGIESQAVQVPAAIQSGLSTQQANEQRSLGEDRSRLEALLREVSAIREDLRSQQAGRPLTVEQINVGSTQQIPEAFNELEAQTRVLSRQRA